MALSRRAAVAIFVVRWVVALALLGAVGFGVRRLFDTAQLRGDQEAAEDAARSGGRNRRGTTTTSAVPDAAAPSVAATTTTTAIVSTGPVEPVDVSASESEADKPDSCGRPVNYDVRNAVDGNTTTAWRAAGDGVGAIVTLTLPGPTRLTQVGLVPGYAKVDQCSNFDRFTQLRRIVSVVWRFDGEVSLPQAFKDRPEMQTMPVDLVTRVVTIEIRATTNEPRLDAIAISEIQLLGVRA